MTPTRRSVLVGALGIAATAATGCGGRVRAGSARTHEGQTAGPAPAGSSAAGGSSAPTPRSAAAPVSGIDLAEHSTTDPASIWVVVDKHRPLPPSYVPGDLEPVGQGQYLRGPAAAAALALVAAGRTAGLDVRPDSGYRTYSYQQSVHAAAVAAHGEEQADLLSARAGYSEHQTGWAVDLGTPGCDIAACFATAPEGQWTAANAHRFGYLLRYRAGGQSVTGFTYEPWHFRYVGVPLATAMHTAGVADLETVFGLPAAPTYR